MIHDFHVEVPRSVLYSWGIARSSHQQFFCQIIDCVSCITEPQNFSTQKPYLGSKILLNPMKYCVKLFCIQIEFLEYSQALHFYFALNHKKLYFWVTEQTWDGYGYKHLNIITRFFCAINGRSFSQNKWWRPHRAYIIFLLPPAENPNYLYVFLKGENFDGK